MNINNIVRNKKVEFVKGEFKGQTGTFLTVTGYTDGYGCVCRIEINNRLLEFTADFFKFIDPKIEDKWNDDSYDFELE